MKLEKRGITLNEKDSVTDMLYMEKTLLKAYEACEKQTEIKEIKGLCQEKVADTRAEIQRLEKEIKNICCAP
jgi:ferritin-like metal-binding protein YciE